ncbi:MAG: helix-turn-helix domain-containing protein [Bacteroidales bacterium]
MSMKQKIILRRYRDGYSQRKIARELGINRVTVRRYLAEYEKARENLSNTVETEEVFIEEIVKIPKYDSSNRGNNLGRYRLTLVFFNLTLATALNISSMNHERLPEFPAISCEEGFSDSQSK